VIVSGFWTRAAARAINNAGSSATTKISPTRKKPSR